MATEFWVSFESGYWCSDHKLDPVVQTTTKISESNRTSWLGRNPKPVPDLNWYNSVFFMMWCTKCSLCIKSLTKILISETRLNCAPAWGSSHSWYTVHSTALDNIALFLHSLFVALLLVLVLVLVIVGHVDAQLTLQPLLQLLPIEGAGVMTLVS